MCTVGYVGYRYDTGIKSTVLYHKRVSKPPYLFVADQDKDGGERGAYRLPGSCLLSVVRGVLRVWTLGIWWFEKGGGKWIR